MKMIEKVARALCKLDGCNPDDEGTTLTLAQYGNIKVLPPEGYRSSVWKFYIQKAKAAIEVMREPSEGMIAVGGGQNEYEAMIDAALKEE